jgi:erythromycin esterase
VRWIGSSLVPLATVESDEPAADLRPLASLIGDASVVAFGENTHGAHEPLALRNRLFRWLVEEKGFTAIALESGFPESRLLADFVEGGPGAPPLADLDRIASRNLTWGFGNFAENLELLRWMRSYNDDPAHRRKLRFYGIDLSLGGPQGSTPTPAAIDGALGFLARVDTTAADELRRRFAPLLRFLPGEPGATMSGERHDELSAAIEALHARLARSRATYVARSSARDFAWAMRNAEVARQGDRVHRVQPPPSPGGGVPASAWRMLGARDSAMAANVLWALEREQPDGKLFVFAHDAHVKSAPTVGGRWRYERPPVAMGQFLRPALGTRLTIIASVGGVPGAAAAPATIDAVLRATGVKRFVIDLRAARDGAARRWLDAEQTLRVNGDDAISLRPAAAFDALIFLDSLSAHRVTRHM